MLGTINGAYLNRAVLNGNGTESFLLADVAYAQDDAVVLAVGVLDLAAMSVFEQAADALASDLDLALTAFADLAQDANALTAAAASLVASMAEWTHDDHTLLSTSRQMLQRKRGDSDLARHATGATLTRHASGSSLTVH